MKRSLVFVATTPFAVNAFLRTHLLALAEAHDVTLCVNTGAYPLLEEISSAVRVQHIDIVRRIEPWQDLRALFQLWRCFREIRPAVVHSLMPKAGLLAMLAGWLAGVPKRFHTFTGQMWANEPGAWRQFLKGIDRLIAFCASRVFADSPSQCRFLEDEGVVRRGGVAVLGQGSMAGVDPARFRPDPAVRAALRAEVGIADDVPVFLFVGRMARDKGVFDLVEAFAAVNARRSSWALWVVGPDEEGLQAALEERRKELGAHIRWFGATSRPERYMAAADVFLLPSYREGFGSVIIEAAACGIPAVAYRIYGVTDAVAEDRTGFLVDKGDVRGLARAMEQLGLARDLRTSLGEAARQRALDDFSSTAVGAAWLAFYATELQDRSPSSGMATKRVFDGALALFALPFLLPLFVLAALMVRLSSPGPILYWSERIGRGNRPFLMPKFRSMRVDAPAVATHLLGNPAAYLTPVGSFLRKSSLDELPQLWSILRGDMSFVGPRPALFNQDDLIALRTRAGVHELVPGLTGWAQINGRDELPLAEKVELDAEYLQRRSFGFDLWIMWLTLLKVLRQDGIAH